LGRPVWILGRFDKHWLHSFSVELFYVGVRMQL